MSRSFRLAFLALLAFVLVTAAVEAQAPNIPTPVVRPFCSITVYGFGGTEAEALANAQAELASKYRVFSSRVVSSRCDTIEMPDPTYSDPFHTTPMTFCSVELSACGIVKFMWINH